MVRGGGGFAIVAGVFLLLLPWCAAMGIVCVAVVAFLGASVVGGWGRGVWRDVTSWARRAGRWLQTVRISQGARARAAQVEAQERATERARSKRRAKALAEVYARCEDLDALVVSLERELEAVRERYAQRAAVITAARDSALLDLADLGRAPAAIAQSVGLSAREVARALAAARTARGLDAAPDDVPEDQTGPTDPAAVVDGTRGAADTVTAGDTTAGAAAGDDPAGRVLRLADHRHATGTVPQDTAGATVLPVAVGQDVPLPEHLTPARRGGRGTPTRPARAGDTPTGAGEGEDVALF